MHVNGADQKTIKFKNIYILTIHKNWLSGEKTILIIVFEYIQSIGRCYIIEEKGNWIIVYNKPWGILYITIVYIYR